MGVCARVERDLKCSFDVVINGGVETSEGIVAGDIETILLLDVVFIVLLADRVDPCQNVNHTHLLLAMVFTLNLNRRVYGLMKRNWKDRSIPSICQIRGWNQHASKQFQEEISTVLPSTANICYMIYGRRL